MKYLIAEDFSGQAVCFLFPRRVDHMDMREQLPYGQIISCGYVEFDSENNQVLRCHGGSNELGIKSRPEDAKIISDALRPQSQGQE